MATHLIIIVVCLIMSAYFSATETAFFTFNRIRVKNLAEKGNKKAIMAMKLADKYDNLISTILIGNNIVNILASAMGTLLFTDLLQSQDLGATVSTIVLTVVVLVFGEISPKSMAKNSPEAFVLFSAPIIRIFYVILYPLSFIFKLWQNLLAKIFKKDDDQGMTEEELISIIEEAEEEGGIDEEEGNLIRSAIEFGDLTVEDIFTPRIDITAIPSDMTKEEIAAVFAESGYSRLPVYEEELDNTIGILYYKDFYTRAYTRPTVQISDSIKPVIYVAKSQPVNELMKELQEKQLHLAIVTDEFGTVAGIVTLEDILEEIVGEIWDEHDEIIEEIKEVGDGEFVVSGKANTDKFFSQIDLDEEPEAVTIGGWAMDALGKIPEVGDKFEQYGLSVEILEMDGRRVESVHVSDERENEDDDNNDDEEKPDSED